MQEFFHQFLVITLKIVYYILINPIFWIAFLGPRILSMNLKFLRGRLGINYKDDQSPPELRDLHNVINKNTWVYAWNDFNTQLFVTIMSFFFVFIETFKIVIDLCMKHGIDRTINKMGESDLTLSLFILFIVIVILSLWIVFSDKLISVEILKKYLPQDNIITGEDKSPPWTTLTYYRGTLLIFGLLFSLWQAFVLKNIVSEIETILNPTNQ